MQIMHIIWSHGYQADARFHANSLASSPSWAMCKLPAPLMQKIFSGNGSIESLIWSAWECLSAWLQKPIQPLFVYTIIIAHLLSSIQAGRLPAKQWAPYWYWLEWKIVISYQLFPTLSKTSIRGRSCRIHIQNGLYRPNLLLLKIAEIIIASCSGLIKARFTASVCMQRAVSMVINKYRQIRAKMRVKWVLWP